MAEIALSMVKSSPAFEGAKSRTMFVAYTFVLHAFLPMHVVMKKIWEAYEIGLLTGDVENAAQSVSLVADNRRRSLGRNFDNPSHPKPSSLDS